MRLLYPDLSAQALQSLRQIKKQLANCSLDSKLVALTYLRVSQINGCSYCLKLHSRELRALGETQERLDELAGWHASSVFLPHERTALQWVDSVTHIAQTHADDADYEPLAQYFSQQQISDLTMAIVLMNAMNRLASAMRQ